MDNSDLLLNQHHAQPTQDSLECDRDQGNKTQPAEPLPLLREPEDNR